MGSDQSESSELSNRLLFVARQQTPLFGPHEIYQLNHQPHDYLLKYQRLYFHPTAKMREQQQLFKSLSEKQHKNMAKLHMIQLHQDNLMCSKNWKLTMFFNYYNFSLRQTILRKKELKQSFREAQLWYILESLLQFALFLKEKNTLFGNFSTDHIYISPQGQVKLFVHLLQPDLLHHSFNQALEGSFPPSPAPQIIQAIPKANRTQLDLGKADMFSLSLCVLCTALMTTQQQFYSGKELNLSELSTGISSVKSDKLQMYMNYALEVRPQRRITFAQGLKYIRNIKQKGTEVLSSLRLKIQDTQRPTKDKPTEIKGSRAVAIRPVRMAGSGISSRSSFMQEDSRLK